MVRSWKDEVEEEEEKKESVEEREKETGKDKKKQKIKKENQIQTKKTKKQIDNSGRHAHTIIVFQKQVISLYKSIRYSRLSAS